MILKKEWAFHLAVKMTHTKIAQTWFISHASFDIEIMYFSNYFSKSFKCMTNPKWHMSWNLFYEAKLTLNLSSPAPVKYGNSHLYRLKCRSHKIYPCLNPKCEFELPWKRGFADIIELRILSEDHPGLSGGVLNPVIDVLIKDKGDTQGIGPEDRGRDWSAGCKPRSLPEAKGSWSGQGKAYSLESLERASPGSHLDLRLWTSRTMTV